MRHILPLFVCWFCVIVAASATGQIAIPATVVDLSGNSVSGLRETDFNVSCGKGAVYKSLQEVSALTFGDFAEPIPTFILLDGISVPSPEQSKISKLLLNLLREAADKRLPIALLVNTPDGVRIVHDVSTDSTVLAAALDTLSGSASQQNPASTQSPVFAEKVKLEITQLQAMTQLISVANPGYLLLESQLKSLELVAKSLQASPGRKLLIWITASFPLRIEGGELILQYVSGSHGGNSADPCNSPHPDVQRLGKMRLAYQGVVNALNSARLSLYSIQVATPGLTGCAPQAMQLTRRGLDDLSLRTGGRNLGVLGEMDLPTALAGIRRKFSSYYLLTFSPDSDLRLSWVKNKIMVKRPDVSVAAPNGFFAGK